MLVEENEAHRIFLFEIIMGGDVFEKKCRVKWLKDGDMNTSYFHKVLRTRKVHTPLNSLMVGA